MNIKIEKKGLLNCLYLIIVLSVNKATIWSVTIRMCPKFKLVDSCFTMAGATGLAAIVMVECKGFGFAFGPAVSLLTRTDAGT